MKITPLLKNLEQNTLWNDALGFGLQFQTHPKKNKNRAKALQELSVIESGAHINHDEDRMVGHYWLRAPELAPSEQIKESIVKAQQEITNFAEGIHSGRINSPSGSKFEHLLLIGIGGSALGPQCVLEALRNGKEPLTVHFFDNCDPDGMQQTLNEIPALDKTLVVVISKSGGTRETAIGSFVAQAAMKAAGIEAAKSFVAVTGIGSKLDSEAKEEGWLKTFPIWDWVGGRTSLWSPVGLLPLALMGINISELLEGAKVMDSWSRNAPEDQNPSLLLSEYWYDMGSGRGDRAMVVLPYFDRLSLLTKYLQQLIMESLGKRLDRSGEVVHQGIVVYGNKGTTDQHAYVQQLRDGRNDFFATFIEVLQDLSPVTLPLSNFHGSLSSALRTSDLEVADGEITSGDYLSGFFQGTRTALQESGRPTLTITLRQLSCSSLGMLLALFERAVGYYAALIDVNAYNQPGVEAGKKAAEATIELQRNLQALLKPLTAESAASIEAIIQSLFEREQVTEQDLTTLLSLLRRLKENGKIQSISNSDSLTEQRFYGA